MFKNKTKLIILLYLSYTYLVEITEVSCSRSTRDEKSENGKDDAQSRVWRDQWKEQSKWQLEDAEPYISVVRGKSREWSNLEHSQPLKRSDDTAGFPNPPVTNDLAGLNISNPISKCHCPINLLYGNNLTVKNYFLLVPRANESCNDTVQQIQSVSEERLEAKEVLQVSQAPVPQAAQGATVAVANATEAETTSSVSEETTSEVSTTPAPTEQSAEMNTTVVETTVATEFSVTFYSNVDNKTMEVMVELFTVSNASTAETTVETTVETLEAKNESTVETKNETMVVETKNEKTVETKKETMVETKNETRVETKNETMVETKNETTVETTVESTTGLSTENTTLSTPSDTKTSPNISDEILRTLDKYCETFNLTDQKQYTINPVTIGTNIDALVEGKSKSSVVELKKQKRTPLEDCVKFNMSDDQNYTIQPIAIPQDDIRLSAKAKVVELKKKKRNLTSKRPKKRSKSVR